jgi:dTDP-4-amino-4,6-dideoxygalactose transaminase
VGAGIFYPLPAYCQQPIIDLGLNDIHLPVTERAAAEVISLPVHPQLSQADLETIVAEVNKL